MYQFNHQTSRRLVRTGCAALALVLSVGAVPFLRGFAAEENEKVSSTDMAFPDGKSVLAADNSFSDNGSDSPKTYAANIVESGSCGDGLMYVIDSEGTLTISGTGAIQDYAFEYKTNFSSVVFDDDCLITAIGKSAFYRCSNLQSITIPESVTAIGDEAFYLCTKLQSITIPSTVTSFGLFIFSQCSALETATLCEGVATTGQYMFENCGHLSSVTLPSTMKTIQYWAFSGCGSLTSITFPDGLEKIGDSSFTMCTGLSSVSVPGSVTTIGNGSFMDCSGLTSLTIEDGVTSIEGSAFLRCNKLTSVTIPGSVEVIHYDAFRSCTGLASLTVSDGVVRIRNGAFWNCPKLTSLTLPDSVTTLERDAFRACTGLTSVVIPDSVTSIGTDVLGDCPDLTSVTIPCGLTVGDTPNITLDESKKATGYFSDAFVTLSHGNHWDVATTATCTQSGIESRVCTVCGAIESEEVGPLGHDWGDWKVTALPTGDEAGRETRVCRRDESHTQSRGLRYAFTSDQYQWTKGSKNGLTVAVRNVAEDGDDSTTIDRFHAVYVDDGECTDFTKKKGSVILTLSPGSLKDLSVGEHTVKVEFKIGDTVIPVEHSFTVVEPAAVPSPGTGESGAASVVCVALMLLAAYGAVYALFSRRTLCSGASEEA